MKPFYWFIRSYFKAYFSLFHRHRTYGLTHIPKGPCIIAPNHASYYDPPLIAISSQEEVYFLARKSLFEHFFLATMIKQLNAFPVSGNTQDLSSFKLIFRLLAENKKVVIFPEGFRSFDGSLSEIKSGIGMIALKRKCPIIPVYIHGSFNIWPRGRFFPKLFGKTACVFGSPILMDDFAALDKKKAQEAAVQKCYLSITALREWYLAGAEGTPP